MNERDSLCCAELVLPRAPWNWPANDINDLCPEYVEPFKALCDAAHKRGMTVLAWYGSVQNLEGAAMWKEHPEFILMGANGQRARTYYSPWGWPGKLEAGFRSYTLDRLSSIRDRTGLDGLWLDSYSSATHLMETADFGEAVRQADGLLSWQGAIEMMGYYTYCEGEPHCIGYPSTSGWEQPEDWSRFRPESYYKRGLYLQQPWGKSNLPHDISAMGRFLSNSGHRFYYRMLANRGCPILDMGHFGTDTAAMDMISRANRDFNAVSDLMETRYLLGGNGVEWRSPKGRAVFAFEDLGYDVPKSLKGVTDVTTGRATAVPRSRRVRLVKYHTYRLEAARGGGGH